MAIPDIEARALAIATADYDAGFTFGVSRETALAILLRPATAQAEREAELAGLPPDIAADLKAAEAATYLALGAEFYRFGPRTRAAADRLKQAREAASAARRDPLDNYVSARKRAGL